MNKKLAEKIIEMRDVDQELRLKTRPGRELINFLIYAIDGIHNQRILKTIKKYGYPTHKLIGEKAMEAFWLLIQHQDYDVDLQEKCLKYCDFNLKNKAFLTDRIMVNKKGVQIYGTQFRTVKNGKPTPFPIKDIGNIEKRRKQAGLEPFSVYTKKMVKDYGN